MELVIAILVFTGFSNQFLKIGFVLYLVFSKILKGKPILDLKDPFVNSTFILLLYSVFITIFNKNFSFDLETFLSIGNEGVSDSKRFVLIFRLFIVEILFSVCLYDFLFKKGKLFLHKILHYSIIINLIGYCFNLYINGEFFRNPMTFPEPSSAGYFYCFILPFLIFDLKYQSKLKRLITTFFLVIGFTIFSKAQLLILIIMALFFATKNIKQLLYIIFLVFLIYFSITELGIAKNQFDSLALYFSNLFDNASYLSRKSGVEETFITRISGITFGVVAFTQNLLGLGFGGFHFWFIENFDLVMSRFDGKEISGVFSGEYYATPNSNILELIVSTGVIGVFYIIHNIKKSIVNHKNFYVRFIILSFLLTGLFLELNPFFAYFAFLIIFSKEIIQSDSM